MNFFTSFERIKESGFNRFIKIGYNLKKIKLFNEYNVVNI